MMLDVAPAALSVVKQTSLLDALRENSFGRVQNRCFKVTDRAAAREVGHVLLQHFHAHSVRLGFFGREEEMAQNHCVTEEFGHHNQDLVEWARRNEECPVKMTSFDGNTVDFLHDFGGREEDSANGLVLVEGILVELHDGAHMEEGGYLGDAGIE